MSNCKKYRAYPTEVLIYEVESLKKYEITLVDRMNRYGPDFWHHKLNGVRIRLGNMTRELNLRVDKREQLV